MWKYSKLITGSATFALFLSIAFFVYETIDSKKDNERISKRLYEVQQSLTTKYLGLFPEYIQTTNVMLRDALKQKDDFSSDTIVIFEDVLYYGITSDSQGFIEVNDKLLQLADRGANVFVVYYDTQSELFVKHLRELLFSPNCYKQFIKTHTLLKTRVTKFQHESFKLTSSRRKSGIAYDQKALTDSLSEIYFSDIISKESFEQQRKTVFKESKQLMPYNVISEMILNEQFFSATRDEDHDAFEKMINSYRKSLAYTTQSSKRQSWLGTMDMCLKIDSLRETLMEQPYDSIRFEDFVKMLSGFTEIIEKEYNSHRNMTLIPIKDYLTMSCWMIGNNIEGHNMIIAFPSRYSSTEIGFESQDENIAQYIHTMLDGISTNYAVKKPN